MLELFITTSSSDRKWILTPLLLHIGTVTLTPIVIYVIVVKGKLFGMQEVWHSNTPTVAGICGIK